MAGPSLAPPSMLLLHPVAQLSWTTFTVHWSTVVGLVSLATLYEWRSRAAGRDPSLGPPPTGGQRALFMTALVTIFLSLNGPLHDLSDSYLFSAHMVQHLVLTLVAPPLLIAGTPASLFRQALRFRAVASVAMRITRPIAAFAIFNVVLAFWHLPLFYNLAVLHHPVHITQHLMFMAAATLMWWPLIGAVPELPRPAPPLQILYCFLMTIPMSIIAIFVTYADGVLYPAYASAPRLWGISPMEDQLYGGLIMWIPGGFFFLGVMAVVFFRWAALEGQSVGVGRRA